MFRRYLSRISINKQSRELNLTFDSGIRKGFSFSWLRDICACKECIHPSTRQKLHSSGDISLAAIPKQATISDSKLHITWCNGSLDTVAAQHETVIPLKELISTPLASNTIEWDSISPTRMSFNSLENPIMFKTLVKSLSEYGIVFVENVPIEDHAVEKLASLFGPIRDTFYGKTWDVKNVKDSKNIAYTNLELGLHMDLLYFESPPTLQFLHSLKNDVNGGHSLFVDSAKAASILKSEYPADYKILKNTRVVFHYKNDGHEMIYKRNMIVESEEGTQVFYAPPFQGKMPPDTPHEWYIAIKTWRDILNRKEMLYRTFLKPGECVVFNNRRVLHGREGFESTGDRHFKGAYVDGDDFKDVLFRNNLLKI